MPIRTRNILVWLEAAFHFDFPSNAIRMNFECCWNAVWIFRMQNVVREHLDFSTSNAPRKFWAWAKHSGGLQYELAQIFGMHTECIFTTALRISTTGIYNEFSSRVHSSVAMALAAKQHSSPRHRITLTANYCFSRRECLSVCLSVRGPESQVVTFINALTSSWRHISRPRSIPPTVPAVGVLFSTTLLQTTNIASSPYISRASGDDVCMHSVNTYVHPSVSHTRAIVAASKPIYAAAWVSYPLQTGMLTRHQPSRPRPRQHTEQNNQVINWHFSMCRPKSTLFEWIVSLTHRFN